MRQHTHFGFSAPLQKTILIGPFCPPPSLRETRTSSLNLQSSDAQFSFDKRDVSVKLLMVLQDSAKPDIKGHTLIHTAHVISCSV